MKGKDYYTLEEAAKQLHYSIRHMRRLIKEHKVSAVKFGRQWRIPKVQLSEAVLVRLEEIARGLEKGQMSGALQQMRDLGLEYIFFYRKDGSWFVDSSDFHSVAHETGREQDSREDGDLQR